MRQEMTKWRDAVFIHVSASRTQGWDEILLTWAQQAHVKYLPRQWIGTEDTDQSDINVDFDFKCLSDFDLCHDLMPI